jgi:hypothetical protein
MSMILPARAFGAPQDSRRAHEHGEALAAQRLVQIEIHAHDP